MRSRWAALSLAAVLGTGCGVGPEDAARPLPRDEAPADVLVERAGPPQPPGEQQQRLYFVRDAQLAPVKRPAAQTTPQTVLTDLLGGPLPHERDRGLTTALPPGPQPGSVTVQDGTALVDLGDRLLDSGRDDPVTALAQVVLSLSALPEVDSVRFVSDGMPAAVPRGDGRVVDGPLRASDFQELLDDP